MNRPRALTMCICAAMLGVLAIGCGGDAKMAELQRISSGDLDIVLLSATDALHHGKDAFTIEFRSKSDAHLVDVGDVGATASMSMSGSPMFGSLEITRTSVPGRYAANSDFGMAGTWRMQIEWDGTAGKGSVGFSSSVQ